MPWPERKAKNETYGRGGSARQSQMDQGWHINGVQ